MVTKAELEAELADLRRKLAERPQADDAPTRAQAIAAEPDDTIFEGDPETWSTHLEDALNELEGLPHKKPILFALGVFTLGYLIGRSR